MDFYICTGSTIERQLKRAGLRRRRRKFSAPVAGIGDPGRIRRSGITDAGYSRFELEAVYVSVFPMSVEPRREVADPLIAATAILPKDATPSGVSAPMIEKETDVEEALDLPWQVVVHNDPVNLMSYVTMVFQRVFGYPRDKAEKHMLEVHHDGRSILWSGMREPAELYVQQLHGYLLLATLEKIC